MENNPKLTSVLSYFGIVFWLVAYLAGDQVGARFHLNQALVIHLCFFIGVIPVVGLILDCVVFVFWILGLVYAIKQEEKKVPLIGDINLLS
ncbi:MAG: hypothetical protein KBS56_04480 [Clostridiales bacterium]|nr:hypothetical protein [Candidatus Crickella equi]